jgi:wyosine [tRNA(Phe)-imidazoG37] synthetase (radical SAM superfamily)
MAAKHYEDDFPTFDEVMAAVREVFKSSLEFNYATFSGNGEPTLYPWFAELVDEIVKLRNKHRPTVKNSITIQLNRLVKKSVRRAITKIDLPVLKLDAGTEKTFKAINRPSKGVEFDTIIQHLASLDNICLQTLFIAGRPSNSEPENLEAYFQKLAAIQPNEAHIYSIDRPVPNTGILLIAPKKLQKIASMAQKKTGITVRAFYKK